LLEIPTLLRFALLLGAALALAGCPTDTSDDDDSGAGDDDDSTPEATEGTLSVSFRIDEDWFDRLVDNGDTAIGPFWGSIYDSEDVTGVGPKDDPRQYGDVYVEEVDLTDGDFTTDVLFTTELLPATWVTILGFVDVDGNSVEDDRDPDTGDPVTLPNANEFLVVAGEETPAEVYFGFLNP
jgi:hypothetical protein